MKNGGFPWMGIARLPTPLGKIPGRRVDRSSSDSAAPRSGVSAESPMVESATPADAGTRVQPSRCLIGRVPACRFGRCRPVGFRGLSVESPVRVAPEPYPR